jgi:type II secretory pathway component PulK
MNNLKNENGYVLVVIIGILTILSLMTITFATLSRIETRATRNYTDSVKCEKIAKAGLEHAIYILRQDKFGDDDVAYNSDNGDENYDWSGETWMPGNIDLSNPTTSFAGNAAGDCDNDGDLTPESKWIYFPATLSTSNSDIRLPGNLRARYAVLITDDKEARVNVNVTGNKANSGSHTSNEGLSTFEIDLSLTIEQVTGISSGVADNIASDIIDARFGTDTASGTSGTNDDLGIVPDPLTDGIDNDGDLIVDEALEDTDEPSEFNAIFPYGDDIPFGILSEAEIMGTTSYESRLEEIFTSNSVTAESLNSWVTTYSADTILCPSYQLDGSTSTTKLNINALVNNEGAYTGAYYDTNRKIQMIAEALAAGGVPSAESQQMAVNIWDFMDTNGTVTNYLTYYGVERTPYINEVEVKVSGSNSKFIELFNPYDSAIDIAGWKITWDVGTTEIILTGPQILADNYYFIDNDGGAGANQTSALIDNLNENGQEITLEDDSGNTVQVTTYGDANNPKSSQLNDPRPPWTWDTSTNDSPGVVNNNFDPTVNNQWTLATRTSSFYIASKNRFPNKGYLCYIHTGNPWTNFVVDNTEVFEYFTIIDPSMDNIDNDGDGSTDTTDTGSQAGDFDGQEYRIPGLINVNTATTQVLQSLPNIDSTIADAIDTPGNKPYTSIGDLVAKVSEITGAAGTKWDEEEALRSISNLITTRSNVFTVYVTAQVIDDAISTVYAEKRILAIVDRSVDPIKVRYFRWLVE